MDIDIILQGLAAAEELELADKVRAGETLQVFVKAPSQEELATLVPPFIIHTFIGGAFKVMTIGSDSVEASTAFNIVTHIVLARQINDLSAQQTMAIAWARYYWAMLLKHRMLTGLLPAPNDGSLISNDLARLPLQFQLSMFDEFGEDVSGLSIPITVDTGRYTIAAGD